MFDKRYATHRREPFFQIAKELFSRSADERILDIGAGDGSFAEYCDVKDMYLFEGNPVNVKNLTMKYKNVKEGKLPFLPYDDEFFDVIHMSHVIEHLHPEEVYNSLKEMNRCCKPGGAIVISAPLLWSGFYYDLSHIRPYPPSSFVKYLTKVGPTATRPELTDKFKVERLQYRYLEKKSEQKNRRSNGLCAKILYKCYEKLIKAGEHFERTGYTIVLRKDVLK